MAPADSDHGLPRKPRSNGAIVALFLAKSKPFDLSIRGEQKSHLTRELLLMDSPDYIVKLRTFIRDGRRPDVAVNGEGYIDSVAFWRDAYEKSQEVEHQLRARILALEDRLESVTTATSQTTQKNTATQPKRKRGRPPAANGSGSQQARKRAKLTNTVAVADAGRPQPVLDDFDLDLTEDTDVNDCLRRIHGTLQKAEGMRNRTTGAKDLARLAIQSAADARRIILSIRTKTILNLNPHKNTRNTTTRTQEQQAVYDHAQLMRDTEIKCISIVWLFPGLLTIHKMLCEFPALNSFPAQVTHSILDTFRVLLEHICALAARESVHKLSIVARSDTLVEKKKRLLAETADFLAAPHPPPEPYTIKDKDKVIEQLCRLAVAMMHSLDTELSAGKEPAGKELLDGFLFFLLLRVADSLRVFVFGSHAPDIGPTTHIEDSERVHLAQAPYLVYLLKHATKLSEKAFNADEISPSINGVVDPRDKQVSRSDRMATVAKLRLQHTLMNAVFGEDANKFIEGLKEPCWSSVDSDLEVRAPTESEGRPQWFKNEVWETVGWDILRSMIKWT